jgi:anthranilate/para-aminobenzoate synthase component II
MILIVDNYERKGGCSAPEMALALAARRQHVAVYGNDCVSLDHIEALNPSLIVLSPGICTPAEAGISVAIVRRFAGQVPILGIGRASARIRSLTTCKECSLMFLVLSERYVPIRWR